MSLLSEADRDGGEPEDEMVAQSKRPRLSSSDALEYEGRECRRTIRLTSRGDIAVQSTVAVGS